MKSIWHGLESMKMDENSIIKVDVDGNVITKGMDKISYVIHSLFPYFGIEKKAVDIYVNEIMKSNLPTDIKAHSILNIRSTFKQLKNLQTIQDIAVDNANNGTDFSTDSKVDEEWLLRYMDSAKFVSSPQVQIVWGKIFYLYG